jgi:Carboxypeptidase regulatory-like domain/PAAR motif
VFVNGRPAVRVDDMGIHAPCCGPNMWQAQQGSPTVFINGKAAFRMNDPSKHCGGQGQLIEGSSDVILDEGGAGGGGSGSGSGGGGSGGGGGGGPNANPPGDLFVQVNSSTGGGVAGATVALSGTSSSSGVTDASGGVTFSGLPPGPYQVDVSANNFSNGTGQATVQSSSTGSTTIVLVPTTGSLDVAVHDSTNHSAIAAAIVTLTGPTPSTAFTDSQGVAHFTTLGAGSYQIAASATGFQNNTGTGAVIAASNANASVDLSPIVGDLAVHVHDLNGTAISGAQVTASGPTNANGTTDAGGDTTLSQLRAGSYTLTVTATGFQQATQTETVAASTAVVDVQLTPVPGNLTVNVTDAGTHRAVSGATVQIAGPASLTQTTDATGAANFTNAPNGTYQVTVSAPRYSNGNGTTNVPPNASSSLAIQIRGNPTVQVLDAAGNVTTFVRFGLWDNAFNASTNALFNDEAAADNFVGADTRRFSFRVNDPSAATRVSINWRARFTGGGDYTDTPADQSLTCVETAANSGIFESKAVMLVADHEDTQEGTHSGLAAGTPDGGIVRNFGQSNHRLRRADMFSEVFAEYDPAAGVHADTGGVPIFQRSPNERRNVSLQIYILRAAVTAAGATPSATGVVTPAQVWAELQQVREIYGRLGVWMFTSTGTIPAAANAIAVANGADSLNVIDPPAGVGFTIDWHTPVGGGPSDVKQIATMYPGIDTNVVRVFYAGALATGDRGWSWGDGTATVNTDPLYGASFLDQVAPAYNAAHEIGHHLTGKTANSGHYNPPAGTARNGDHNDLMKNGTSVVTGARESKRLWDINDADGNDQLTSIMGSHYVRP